MSSTSDPSRPRIVRGPLIVAIVLIVGFGVGIAGVLWMRAARPVPGAYVDALAIPGGVIAVRAERGGEHGFVELWSEGRLRWRGFIPTYDGRPGTIGVRVSPVAVQLRVRRGGAPATFELERSSGVKRASGAMTVAEADAAFPAATTPLPVGYDPATRTITAGAARHVLPPAAIVPQPYHADGGVLWIVTPDALTALSLDGLTTVATLR